MDRAHRSRTAVASPILAAGVLSVTLVGLAGCRFDALNAAKLELVRQGHAATVDCLQAERAITGGDELRCEEWTYVRDNYLRPKED
jgi:hypothetical protein